MKLPKIELRPLPESIVVVAFPDAFKESHLAISSNVTQDFFIVQAPCDMIQITRPEVPWLTLSKPAPVSAEVSRIDYQATDNTRLMRKLPVILVVHGKPYQIEFIQQGGYLVQDEMVRVLNSPLTIDFLVAVTYIASLIKKIPIPPIKLIVAIIAVLAIIALSIAIAAVRHAFINVPEPRPLSTDTNGIPITIFPGLSVDTLPLKNVSAEDQTIALQMTKEIYWFIKQIAS